MAKYFPFIHEDFLLDGEAARRLYHDYAKAEPIVDYHNHLPPSDILDDRKYENPTEIWLEGDHYKWRAMRANGVDERLITGDAPPREKFRAWAATVPALLANPLFHWTHMELAHPFGLSDRLLDESTADYFWERIRERLVTPEFSCRGLLKQWPIRYLCTTDDPADDLSAHQEIAEDDAFELAVYPTFRPDRALNVETPVEFRAYLERLGEAADIEIRKYADLIAALENRRDAFHDLGCRLSDHGLTEPVAEDYCESETAAIFDEALSGRVVDDLSARKYKSALMLDLGRMVHQRGWTQQYHIGPLRNLSTRLNARCGADAGGDAIVDGQIAPGLAKMLDRLDAEDRLPRTIIYNLNPAAMEVVAAIVGSFQDGSARGKIQLGSAWWFNDQEDGIVRQLAAFSNHGALGSFIGMTTDSRSFLSFSRHEYFRRILCNFLGSKMESGRLPSDFNLVGGVIRDICYTNILKYLGFDDPGDR